MTDPIWKKTGNYGGPDAAVMEILAGQDVVLDRQLIFHDIHASQAHARGLATIGVISEDEAEQLASALAEIGRELETGALELDQQFEDGHSALEHWLTERLGPFAMKTCAVLVKPSAGRMAAFVFVADFAALSADSAFEIITVAGGAGRQPAAGGVETVETGARGTEPSAGRMSAGAVVANKAAYFRVSAKVVLAMAAGAVFGAE